jgi:hypothetical protein
MKCISRIDSTLLRRPGTASKLTSDQSSHGRHSIPLPSALGLPANSLPFRPSKFLHVLIQNLQSMGMLRLIAQRSLS